METLWRVKIAGVGRYLPRRVVTSAEVEAMIGLEPGYAERRSGVKERRWAAVSEGETASFMGAEAAKEALARAGLGVGDVDLVLNASGTPEQVIPDGGPLIHRHLGMQGTAAMSIHATCLSFLAALEVAAERLSSGRVGCVLIVSTDITSVGLDPTDPEVWTLFGDAAAAAVVVRTPEGEASAIHRSHFETWSEGADLTAVRGGGTARHPNQPTTRPEDNLFHMRGPEVLDLAVRYAPGVMQRLGIIEHFGSIGCVIAHQTSKAGIKAMRMMGFPAEKVPVTLDRQGNCVAASIPSTLYQAIEEGTLQRGDLCLMCGTGAGLSLAGVLLTY